MPMSEESQSPAKTATASKSGVGRFLRFSMIYALGDVLTKGAQIILVPYYISVLPTTEVGMLAVLTTLFFATWTTLSFGLGFAVRRFYYTPASDESDARKGSDVEQNIKGDRMVTSLWLFRMFFGLPFLGVLIALVAWLHSAMSSEIPWSLVLMAMISGYLKGGQNIVESWLIIREEPVKYRGFTFLQFLTTTALIITLVTGFEMGVTGAIVGELASFSLWTLLSAVWLFKRALPRMDAVDWKSVSFYCLPILPHTFFMWGVASVDRFLLDYYLPLGEIGVYDIGYKLASFLSVILMAMRSAWLPNYFRTAEQTGAFERYASIATVFFYFLLFGALGGILFAPELIHLASFMAIGDYSQATQIVRIIVTGIVAMGMFMAFNQPLLYNNRTGILAMVSAAGLLVNVVTNVWLIPRMGITGAAIATVAAYLTMASLMFVIVRRLYGCMWENGQLWFLFFASAGFAVLGCWLTGEPWTSNTMVRIALLLLFPLMTLFKIQRTPQARLAIASRFQWTNLKAEKRSG